jgi:TrmH family RNA methyltransferase
LPIPAEFDGLCVVLVAARNPLNIGAVARAISNFGLIRLRVVNPYEVAFREARSAVGASALLASAEVYKNVAEAVADCALVVGTTAIHHRKLQHPLRRLEYGARLIRRQLASSRIALLFGSEKRGLSNHDLSYCNWLMRIPTREEHSSMNLGQAVAVCLYELVREAKCARPAGKLRPATGGDVERIAAMLFDALRASGYVRPGAAASTHEKVRRLVRRLHMQASDAEVWIGMLRQIVWKLRSGNS